MTTLSCQSQVTILWFEPSIFSSQTRFMSLKLENRQVVIWIVWIIMVFLRTYPIIAQVFIQIKAQFEALLVEYNFDSFKDPNNERVFGRVLLHFTSQILVWISNFERPNRILMRLHGCLIIMDSQAHCWNPQISMLK